MGFVSAESSTLHCLLLLDATLVLADGALAGPNDAQSVAVSFRLGGSPLYCPAGFPSARVQEWFI